MEDNLTFLIYGPGFPCYYFDTSCTMA